jgi:hypothetical protein
MFSVIKKLEYIHELNKYIPDYSFAIVYIELEGIQTAAAQTKYNPQ